MQNFGVKKQNLWLTKLGQKIEIKKLSTAAWKPMKFYPTDNFLENTFCNIEKTVKVPI